MPTQAEIDHAKVETEKHIDQVRTRLLWVAYQLILRSAVHDKTKLEDPELATFAEVTPKLLKMTYGSEEYMQTLAQMKPALEHHYAHNSHHPEHYPNGVDGMDLLDLIEMFCDWKAATLRHADGSLEKSIEVNKKRFGLSDQLCNIFRNTIGKIEPKGP